MTIKLNPIYSKFNRTQDGVIAYLSQLPAFEGATNWQFQAEVTKAFERLDARWKESTQAKTSQEKRFATAQRKRERAEELAYEREDWARENLTVGMLVKATGTRDGHGLRLVVELKAHEFLGRQMKTSRTEPENKENAFLLRGTNNHEVWLVPGDYMTSHSYNKVSARAKKERVGRVWKMFKLPTNVKKD